MNFLNKFRIRKAWQKTAALLSLTSCFLLAATPAFAHHALDGKTPSNFFEGFLSGLAHPIIGLDHFAIVVSIGLLAAIHSQGIFIPISFLLTAMLGTSLHLAGASIPGIELLVTGSILLFGLLLVKLDRCKVKLLIGLAAIAGLLHGYAYGEAIFGAKMMPLLAYLAGFTVIQIVVSLIAFVIAKAILSRQKLEQQAEKFRSAGFVIFGIGFAFFASQLVEALLPLPNG
ncbi:HupE/UreJ family protein [Microcoleus sp. FACHB-1515]|uniref:HupE/UreJ family protein n=1 Tax=Cyanophyceae TaxID=3028117 RepID=UPI0016872B5D|nr:HupE/UreJ family protein [Microcoleus sp. FACHB-1515]MBD2089167.1 HupE/UreJ family protein [Microcoleus sp. FACHB-1515]